MTSPAWKLSLQSCVHARTHTHAHARAHLHLLALLPQGRDAVGEKLHGGFLALRQAGQALPLARGLRHVPPYALDLHGRLLLLLLALPQGLLRELHMAPCISPDIMLSSGV